MIYSRLKQFNTSKAKPILDEFTCAVCFELIKNCATTSCSHSFCRACIEECLNIKKKCPTCQAPVELKQVYSNIALDRICKVIQQSMEYANAAQFSHLLKPQGSIGITESSLHSENSGLEEIFRRHMMKSLGIYSDFLKV